MKSKVIHTLVLIGAVTVRLCLIRPQVALADEDERTWSFNDDAVGSVPEGWEVAETAGRGTPGAWKVVTEASSPSAPNAIAITAVDNRGGTYNLLIAKDTSYRDLEIEVMVKAGTGNEDQGGGPIWRAADTDNYYVVRWNPLEDNFRVYFVKDGRRGQIASAEFKAESGNVARDRARRAPDRGVNGREEADPGVGFDLRRGRNGGPVVEGGRGDGL